VLIFENESKKMSASTVRTCRKTDKLVKCKNRISKCVKVGCKRFQNLTGIFKGKTSEQTFRSVISFRSHKINCAFDSLFIRFRKNILTVLSVNDVEYNHIELITKYVILARSPFVNEQVISHFTSKESEGNVQCVIINFLPFHNTTLDLEMAQFKMSHSKDKEKLEAENHSIHKSYPKYLPIKADTSSSETYLRTEVDTKAPMSWLDVQAWYIRQRNKDNGIRKSKSDTQMACSNRQQKLNGNVWRRKKVKHLTTTAEEYVTNILNMHEASFLEVVIQMMPGISHSQYLLRTDLLIDCLKFFCFPFELSSVEVKCVATLADYFAKDAEIDNSCSCVVKVEGPVSVLFKKKELAVWDTLGHIIGINPKCISLL
jgi:hypothetical protein